MATTMAGADETFVDRAALTRRYGCSPRAIGHWIQNAGFPKPLRCGPRLARWKWSDVLAWEATRQGAAAG